METVAIFLQHVLYGQTAQLFITRQAEVNQGGEDYSGISKYKIMKSQLSSTCNTSEITVYFWYWCH